MFRRKRTAALLFGIDATPVFAKITLLKPGAASRPGAQTLAYLSNNSRRTHFNVVHRLEGQTSVKTKSNVYFATTKPLPAPTHFPSTLKWGRDLIAKVYTAPLSPRPPLPRRSNVVLANTGVAVSIKLRSSPFPPAPFWKAPSAPAANPLMHPGPVLSLSFLLRPPLCSCEILT